MSDSIRLSFHGAAGTVTGSKHLVEVGDTRILLDAGMFQGIRELRQRNWQPPAFDPKSVDYMMLSHTHIDHVGYLPRLVKLGMKAPVFMTPPAFELCELMLLDSAKIQEEDAKRANRKGYTRHKPAKPLYDRNEARRALEFRHELDYGRWQQLGPNARGRFRNSGHLLGAAFVELELKAKGRTVRLVFSADIGRFDVPLHLDPEPCPSCDALILESTYGDRLHTEESTADQLREPLGRALGRGGIVLIPAFAVGRSQQVTLVLRRLMRDGVIPDVPIHIDSPMAVNATEIYTRFLNEENIDPDVFEDGRLRLFPERVTLHRTVDESKALNRLKGPRIVISASGMLSGGRVLHHLKRLAPDGRNLILLAGYQAPGTRARDLIDGVGRVKVHGQWVTVRAEVESLRGLSGHGDRDELLRWVDGAEEKPRAVFMVHGEPASSAALSTSVEAAFGARTYRPEMDQSYDLLDILDRASR